MILLTLTVWFVLTVVCTLAAIAKGRSPILWFLIGVLVPVFGVILVLALPPTGRAFALRVARLHGPELDRRAQAARRAHLQTKTLDAIARLGDLKNRGAITSIEFDEKKAELLARV